MLLTPVLSKVQEQFVHKWMFEVIKFLFDSNQFGAIKGSCPTFALLMIIHDWLKSMDNSKDKSFVQIILLDYAMEFDHINPSLIEKLAALNIPDFLLRWIESFLINRRQRVKIGTYRYEWVEIWGTVSQGMLIGMLCFIAMLNNLITPCHTIKYVDDTTVYSMKTTPQTPAYS